MEFGNFHELRGMHFNLVEVPCPGFGEMELHVTIYNGEIPLLSSIIYSDQFSSACIDSSNIIDS